MGRCRRRGEAVVDVKTRRAYEEGQRDREKGLVDRMITDITGKHSPDPAYYKGRRDEQLDGDKKQDDKK